MNKPKTSRETRGTEQFHRTYLSTSPLVASDESWQGYINSLKTREEKKYVVPISLKSSLVEENVIVGTINMPVYYLNREATHGPHLVFLHGGAYVEPATPYHWQTIDALAQTLGIEVILPLFPLAPFHTYTDAYTLIEALYRQLIAKHGAENIAFSGDSAGAGLATGFCLELKKLALPQPSKLILFSPWVDISMSNPEISKYQKDDCLIDKKLYIAGLAWAGEPHDHIGGIETVPKDSKIYDYHISPIYGDLHGLPPTLLFSGTHELLFPDCAKFNEKMQASGVKCTFVVGDEQFHVWPVNPTPEAETALRQTCEFLIPHSTDALPPNERVITKDFHVYYLRPPDDSPDAPPVHSVGTVILPPE